MPHPASDQASLAYPPPEKAGAKEDPRLATFPLRFLHTHTFVTQSRSKKEKIPDKKGPMADPV